MRTYTKIALFQKIIVAVGFLVLIVFSLPVMALPPATEELFKSATDNLSKNNLEEAHKDFEKIKALKVELPTDFYFLHACYFVAIRQAGKAKKNLETYLNKTGKVGRFYAHALELYRLVEKNEKRWARFKYNGDGTITDTKTGLMWAATDSGKYMDWETAESYCQNYKGGNYTDWRLPQPDELVSLYDPEDKNKHGFFVTSLIHVTGHNYWSSTFQDPWGTCFNFGDGKLNPRTYNKPYYQALPVRGAEPIPAKSRSRQNESRLRSAS